MKRKHKIRIALWTFIANVAFDLYIFAKEKTRPYIGHS